MRTRRAIHALAIISIAALTLPQVAPAGTFYIHHTSRSCWCDGTVVPQGWNVFSLVYAPAAFGECTFVRAAFRIQGVPDDPALMRRFDPLFPSMTVTGDPFGEGAIVEDFVAVPGDTDVGSISIYVANSLAPQAWSVEAHQGMQGTTSPVAQFEGAAVWVPQSGRSTVVGDTSNPCDSCEPLGPLGCPFAIEPQVWSVVKRLYR